LITATIEGPAWQRIEMPRRLDAAVVRGNTPLWERIANSQRHCLLGVSDVEFVDSAGMGVIISLHKRLQAAGWRLVLIDPSRAMRSVIAQMRLREVLNLADDIIAARDLIRARWPAISAEGMA
jgi:anti-sigma B factor antagonist